MKKIVCFIFLICFVNVLFADKGDIKYVAVEEVNLKTGTYFFSRNITEVMYGQEVIVLTEKGNWTEVRLSDNESVLGWIPTSSLTSKKIVIRDDKSVSTSAEELALAGKGFNQEVEDVIASESDIDFSLVDSMESNTVSEDDLIRFIVDGKLNGVEE